MEIGYFYCMDCRTIWCDDCLKKHRESHRQETAEEMP